MIHLLSPLAYRVLPWKNGGGTTTEIAVDPEGANWDVFNWRVAIADIRASGPFSRFPGIDRSIVLLENPKDARRSEISLDIDGNKVRMVPREFIDFSGDAETHCELNGPPALDFNVMSRRDAIKHRRGWKSVSANELFRLGGTDQRFVYVVSGEAELINAVSARTVAAGETLVASGDETLVLRGGENGAQLVWVVFSAAG